jgi:hypothetical protein
MFNFFLLQGSKTYLPVTVNSNAFSNLVATEQKISSFAALPSGWHYGVGSAPLKGTIQNALDWHRQLMGWGFVTTDAFPGADGAIMIAAYRDEHVFEVVLEADNTVSFYHEKNDESLASLSHATPGDVERAIETIVGDLWSTFGSYTTEILTPRRIDSTDWHLRTLTAAGQSFSMIAYSRPEHPSAPISADIIQTLPGSLLYSGFSTRPLYQLVAR